MGQWRKSYKNQFDVSVDGIKVFSGAVSENGIFLSGTYYKRIMLF